jgi:hypothetical protein
MSGRLGPYIGKNTVVFFFSGSEKLPPMPPSLPKDWKQTIGDSGCLPGLTDSLPRALGPTSKSLDVKWTPATEF